MEEVISEFISDTADSLTAIDQSLILLEQQGGDKDILDSIFRLLHTIKGTCGFLGLARLEAIAHASEEVLESLREGALKVTPDIVSLILESFDAIRTIVKHMETNGSEPVGDDTNLISRLKAVIPGHAPAEVTPDVIQAPPAPELDDAPTPESVEPVEEATIAEEEDVVEEAAEKVSPEQVAAPQATARKSEVTHATQFIRVRLDILESLMQIVGELVLTRNQLLQMVRESEESQFASPLQRLSYITTELQERVMQTRMQQISNAWSAFPRMVRELSRDLGKKVQLEMKGSETELDRLLIDVVKDPLTHMVRNAIDHGIEMPLERKAKGKPEEGTLLLNAYHEGGHIIVEIGDDGRGLNVTRIREKVLEKGLASKPELASMGDTQVMQYIFSHGFSTAEQVTNVSGRGVGMDVVATNIRSIGGTVEIDSEEGKGARFKVKIPLTLAIVSVLVVETAKQRFAIPQVNIVELVQVRPGGDIVVEKLDRAYVLRLRGKLLPLVQLSEVLECTHASDAQPESYFIVVCKVGKQEFGVMVNQVYDIEEIVVKPVISALQRLDIYSGCTILGDGNIIMILDLNGLVKRVGVSIAAAQENDDAADRIRRLSQKISPFLLFTTEDATPKAVPLELVSRLEIIERAKVEHSVGSPVVQYRDRFMHLITLDNSTDYLDKTFFHVVVFEYDGKLMGLVAKNIVDIVEAPLEITESSPNPLFLGSMVIQERTVDVIDVANLKSLISGRIQIVEPAAREKKYSILIAEDSPIHRNLIGPFLASRGYDVVLAEDGAHALSILSQDPNFDLIITDIEMPKMDGFELAQACKARDQIKQIPMIAFTGRMTENAIKRGTDIGFDGYISKTDREGLMQSIGEILSGKRRKAA